MTDHPGGERILEVVNELRKEGGSSHRMLLTFLSISDTMLRHLAAIVFFCWPQTLPSGILIATATPSILLQQQVKSVVKVLVVVSIIYCLVVSRTRQ